MKINVAADLPTNITHVATFRGELAAIARERGFSMREGTDDLDELAWMIFACQADLPSGYASTEVRPKERSSFSLPHSDRIGKAK
jgi:hypothetical protein